MVPLNQRANHVFLSHSSRDKLGFVDGLYEWLSRTVELKVWYDRNLGSGQVARNVDQAIEDCKSAVIVISEHAAQSQWVTLECSRLQEEVARTDGEFRIATIRLDGADAPGLLKSFKHIDLANGTLTGNSAALLMDTLFGGKPVDHGHSIYLSRGWRESERATADKLCRALRSFRLQPVCDWIGQSEYRPERIRGIMEGTGGFAAILPHRGSGETSPYMIRELAMARDIGIPIIVFAHRDVQSRPEWQLSDALLFDNGIAGLSDDEIVDSYGNRIEEFSQAWRTVVHGDHVFLGHSLEKSIDDRFLTARNMLSRITGLPIKVGRDVTGNDAPPEIIQLIRQAALCVIDITNRPYDGIPPKIDFGLNSSVEAGVALGAGKTLYLTCHGASRTPPFMFRNKKVLFYENDLELIGILCRIAKDHRRTVL